MEKDRIELSQIQKLIVNKEKQLLGVICLGIGFIIGIIFGIKVV